MSITTNALAIGWTRDRQGRVTKYHLRPVCNCITTFCGGGIRIRRPGWATQLPMYSSNSDKTSVRVGKSTHTVEKTTHTLEKTTHTVVLSPLNWGGQQTLLGASDGLCRTLKSNYYKVSVANVLAPKERMNNLACSILIRYD